MGIDDTFLRSRYLQRGLQRTRCVALSNHGLPAMVYDHGLPSMVYDHGLPAMVYDHGLPAMVYDQGYRTATHSKGHPFPATWDALGSSVCRAMGTVTNSQYI